MQSTLNCQQNGHNNKQVIGVCMNVSCKQFRPCCMKCIKDNHFDHFKDVIEFDDLKNYKKNNEELNTMKNVLLNTKQILSQMIKDINILMDQMNNQSIQINAQSSLNEIHQQVQQYINIDQNNNQSPLEKLMRQNEEILQILKYASQNIIEYKTNESHRLIVCDNLIPMDKITTIKFKIIKTVGKGWGFEKILYSPPLIGIFFKSKIQYYQNTSNYKLSYTYDLVSKYNSPLIKDEMRKSPICSWNNLNEIIELSVDPKNKTITWKNLNNNNQFSLPFELSNDLILGIIEQEQSNYVEIIK